MKRYLIFFFCLLFSAGLYSQSSKIESLKKALLTAKDGITKARLCDSLYSEYEEADFDSALLYAEKMFRFSEQNEAKSETGHSLNKIAHIFFMKGEFEKALVKNFEAVKTFEEIKDSAALSVVIADIANSYGAMGNYAEALKYQLRALKIKEKFGNKHDIANSLQNICTIYFYLKNYKTALEYGINAMNLYKESGDKKSFSTSLTMLGNINYATGEYEKALEYLKESLKIKEELNDKNGAGRAWINIGNVYYELGDFKKVSECDQKSIALLEETNDKAGLATCYNNAGETLAMLGDFDKALVYHNKALSISREINSLDDVKNVYNSLSNLYASKKDYQRAYEYHVKYAAAKDSVFNEESSKQITEMQTKYDTEKKEQQIQLLNKDKEIQEASINRQKIIIWSVAAGLLVVLTLSIFIFRERRKSEKLLLNILPAETARELKAKGKATAKHYESVTVMFTDFKGFTTIAEELSAEELVSELDFIFKKFDEIISEYSIEKIKTIGDAYMCASGLPTPNPNHAEEIVKAGIEIQNWMKEQNGKWSLRMGIHTGPVTAGVVGDKKFAYDIWGDTVNTASRMESSGEPGKINISGNTYQIIKDKFTCVFRGRIPAKNKGEIEMYFVDQG